MNDENCVIFLLSIYIARGVYLFWNSFFFCCCELWTVTQHILLSFSLHAVDVFVTIKDNFFLHKIRSNLSMQTHTCTAIMMTRNLKRLQNGKDEVIKCIKTVWKIRTWKRRRGEEEWRKVGASERIKQILYCRTHGKKVEGIGFLNLDECTNSNSKMETHSFVQVINFICVCTLRT